MQWSRALVVAATVGLWGRPGALTLQAQVPLSLREALERADQSAYPNRIARGARTAESGAALAPYQGILPSIRFESSYLRTTDPLNAFGFTLRQRAVTPAAFAPDALNYPDPTGNLTTGVVLEQPIFNADAWLGRSAAGQASQASAAAERWTQAGTAVQVVRAYWGVVLAEEQARTLGAGLTAARSHQQQAESMARQGMVTQSDVLLASVKAGEVEAMLLGAESDRRLARRQLVVLLGDSVDSDFLLPGALPDVDQLVALRQTAGEPLGPGVRGDVEAAVLSGAAATANARRANARYLPRLNGFGRLDWFSQDTPFGGQSAWTVGLALQWTPFTGAAEIAAIRSARGQRSAARAAAEAAGAQAALERARTRDDVELTYARMDIANRGAAQAAEAHRIVGRKYEGGLSTVTELLDAAAAETNARLRDAASRYGVIVALAEMRKAHGDDLVPLLALDLR